MLLCMLYMQEVHEENALWAGRVCPSIRLPVRVIHLHNH
jgi:hypothetical protein